MVKIFGRKTPLETQLYAGRKRIKMNGLDSTKTLMLPE